MHAITKAALGLAAAGTLIAGLSACGDSGASAGPAAVTTVTASPKPKPKPVNPDEAFLAAVRAKPAISGRMQTVATQIVDFSQAKDLSAGANAARSVSGSYDWLAERMDREPTSPDSPLAQRTMSTFRLCRDAYGNAADAIDQVDPDGMDTAGTEIQTCARDLESVTARF